MTKDVATTVRGHPGVLRIQLDRYRRFVFRELIWRERSDLQLAVQSSDWLSTGQLRLIAANLRSVTQDAWQRLVSQASAGCVRPL